jgi:hypothetical protein
MKAPPGISHLSTIDSRMVIVAADGTVELTEAEAAPLATAGWLRLDNPA